MSEFCHKVRVYYEDTDAGGIVYHPKYLHFAERARSELLGHVGLSNARLYEQDGVRIVVRNMVIDYKAPAFLEDELNVITHVKEIGRASLSLLQTIKRDDNVIAVMDVSLAIINNDGRPCAMPVPLQSAMESL